MLKLIKFIIDRQGQRADEMYQLRLNIENGIKLEKFNTLKTKYPAYPLGPRAKDCLMRIDTTYFEEDLVLQFMRESRMLWQEIDQLHAELEALKNKKNVKRKTNQIKRPR